MGHIHAVIFGYEDRINFKKKDFFFVADLPFFSFILFTYRFKCCPFWTFFFHFCGMDDDDG